MKDHGFLLVFQMVSRYVGVCGAIAGKNREFEYPEFRCVIGVVYSFSLVLLYVLLFILAYYGNHAGMEYTN